MLASPTVSATSRAGQPRPGAPAWAQPGAARVRTARALVATDLGGSGAHGSSVLGRAGRSSTLCLGWKLGVLGLRTQRRGAQLFPPDVGCPVRSFFLLPRGWQSAPPPTAGAARGWGEAGGIPLREFGFPHLARTPGSVRCRRCCENHFRAAQPVPPAPAGGGGSAAHTGTGKEVTFKP